MEIKGIYGKPTLFDLETGVNGHIKACENICSPPFPACFDIPHYMAYKIGVIMHFDNSTLFSTFRQG